MTDWDQWFKYVPVSEVEQHIADGWKLAPRYQDAGHHLRYTVPMCRDVEEGA